MVSFVNEICTDRVNTVTAEIMASIKVTAHWGENGFNSFCILNGVGLIRLKFSRQLDFVTAKLSERNCFQVYIYVCQLWSDKSITIQNYEIIKFLIFLYLHLVVDVSSQYFIGSSFALIIHSLHSVF